MLRIIRMQTPEDGRHHDIGACTRAQVCVLSRCALALVVALAVALALALAIIVALALAFTLARTRAHIIEAHTRHMSYAVSDLPY